MPEGGDCSRYCVDCGCTEGVCDCGPSADVLASRLEEMWDAIESSAAGEEVDPGPFRGWFDEKGRVR